LDKVEAPVRLKPVPGSPEFHAPATEKNMDKASQKMVEDALYQTETIEWEVIRWAASLRNEEKR